MQRPCIVGLAVICSFLLSCCRASPITNPLKPDGDIAKVIPDYFDSKRAKEYHTLTPTGNYTAYDLEIDHDHNCGLDFRLRWSSTLGSPVFSTPVLFPDRHGKLQIFASTYYSFIELLDQGGFKPWGWPISFEESSFQSSPIIHDIDGDGNNDVGVVDKQGNMFWIRVGDMGEYLEDYHIQIPKLKVKRDWAEGLDASFIDANVRLSMFDHKEPKYDEYGNKVLDQEGGPGLKAKVDDLKTLRNDLRKDVEGTSASTSGSGRSGGGFGSHQRPTQLERRRRLTATSSSSPYPSSGGNDASARSAAGLQAGGDWLQAALQRILSHQQPKQQQQQYTGNSKPNRHSVSRRLQEAALDGSEQTIVASEGQQQQQQIAPQAAPQSSDASSLSAERPPQPQQQQQLQQQQQIAPEAAPQSSDASSLSAERPPHPQQQQHEEQQQHEQQQGEQEAAPRPIVPIAAAVDENVAREQQQEQQQQQLLQLQLQQVQREREEQERLQKEGEAEERARLEREKKEEEQRLEQQQQRELQEKEERERREREQREKEQREKDQAEKERVERERAERERAERVERERKEKEEEEERKKAAAAREEEERQQQLQERERVERKEREEREEKEKEEREKREREVREKQEREQKELREREERAKQDKEEAAAAAATLAQAAAAAESAESEVQTEVDTNALQNGDMAAASGSVEVIEQMSEEDKETEKEAEAAAEALARLGEEEEEELASPEDDMPSPEQLEGAYGYGGGGEMEGARSMDDGASYYMSVQRGYGYGGMVNESDFVFVDAHVLSSPAIVDINGDGHIEIIFAVSYYFDKEQYRGREQALGFDPDMYVAGGIVCWDMEVQEWAWSVHLDLTTTKSKNQAMIYASPTVVDLDGDGRMEVIIGTALGLLYVLDGESGFVRRFFPMQFHSIQAQVAVADVMDDLNLEIIVADMGGTLAVVDVRGDVRWDLQLSGALPFTPTVGDVNGDGVLDIVVIAVVDPIDINSNSNSSSSSFNSSEEEEEEEEAEENEVGNEREGKEVAADGKKGRAKRVKRRRTTTSSSKNRRHSKRRSRKSRNSNLKEKEDEGEGGGEERETHVWVVEGTTGRVLPGYPLVLPGNAIATSPALLIDLKPQTAASRFDSVYHTQQGSTSGGEGRVNFTQADELKQSLAAAASASGKAAGNAFSSLLDETGKRAESLSRLLMKSAQVSTQTPNQYKPGLHIVLSTYAGHVYIIDGSDPKVIIDPAAPAAAADTASTTAEAVQEGKREEEEEEEEEAREIEEGGRARVLLSSTERCTQRIDIGEHLYSVPLIHDLSGDGYLDMVVGTMNGEVMVFESSVPYHPMNAWDTFPKHGINGFTHGVLGIALTDREKGRLKQLDLRGGREMSVTFEIFDARPMLQGGKATVHDGEARYSVTVTRGTNRVEPLWSEEFTSPGVYTIFIPISPPEVSNMVISMVNEHGQYFYDTFHVSISTRFYVWIKYMIVSPLIVLCTPLLIKYSGYL